MIFRNCEDRKSRSSLIAALVVISLMAPLISVAQDAAVPADGAGVVPSCMTEPAVVASPKFLKAVPVDRETADLKSRLSSVTEAPLEPFVLV